MPSTFYSFKRIMSYNCVFNFVPGGRAIGKTYGMKEYVINDALTTGSEFIYVRRYKEELAETAGLFFDDIAHLWPKWDFRVGVKYAEAVKKLVRTEGESERAYDLRLKNRKWQRIGHFIAMSTYDRYKGTPFTKVRTIIVDEFILEKGATSYLPDEATKLLNFYNTVDRYKDRVRVFCLANAVSINNPYFLKWKITPSTDGKIQVIRDIDGRAFMAVDFPDSKAFQSEVYETRFGKFIQGTDYADYAVGNIFKDNGANLIKSKDSTAEYVFTMQTSAGDASVWISRTPGKETEYFISSRQPKLVKMMTLNPDNVTPDMPLLLHNDTISKILRGAYNKGICNFDAPETRNMFIETFIR
jgi:hypothetical protein